MKNIPPAGFTPRTTSLVLLASLLLLVPRPALAAAAERLARDIDALVQRDREQPPPEGAVLFVGSSSIRRWQTVAKDFPGVPVINHGFGGSEISDSVFYFDRIVQPVHPRVVVFYAGENDLQAGKSPDTVVADFAAFRAKVEKALPATQVIFVSLKPSPSRWALREKMIEVNTRIAAMCAADRRLRFVDVFTPMLDAQGQPRPELFVEDMLHMNAEGYKVWTKALEPLLRDFVVRREGADTGHPPPRVGP